MADEALILEAVRRGILPPEQARAQLGIKPMTSGDVAGDIAGSAATGVTDALSGFAGLPGELQKLRDTLGPTTVQRGTAGPTTAAASASPPALPTAEDVRNFFSNMTGVKMHQPETTAGKYAHSLTEGATSFFNPFNPTSKVGPAFGGAMGLGGEAGAQMMKEQPAYGRMLGGLPFLAAGAYPALKSSQLAQALARYMNGIGSEGLQSADLAAKAAAKTLGTPTVLTQGMETETPLSGVTRAVAAEPGGANIQKILAAQPEAGRQKAQELVDQLSPRGLDQTDANAVVAAGKEAAYTQPDRAITAASRPLYEASSKDVMSRFGPGPSLLQMADDIAKRKMESGLRLSGAGDSADRRINTIVEAMLSPQPTNVKELDALFREARNMGQASFKTGASDKAVLGAQGEKIAAKVINEADKAASPALAGGKMVYQTGKDWLQNPALEKMFPTAMADAGVGDWSTLTKALNSASAGDIREISRGLAKSDPGAFANVVKKSWQDKLDASIKDVAGRTPDELLTAIPNAIRGGAASQQRAAFDATIEEVAKSAKLDPVAARQSANELMDAMRVAAREQGGKGVVSPEMSEGMRANMATRFFRSLSLTSPGRGFGWWLEKKNYREVIDKVQDALTSPDGLQTLIDLSNYSSKAHQIKTVARALAGTAVQNQPLNTYGQE